MAAGKRFFWLKLNDKFFSDKRIKKLRKIPGGAEYTIIYLKMLLMALQDGGKLFYDGIEKDIASEIALSLDEDDDAVAITVNFLLKYGLMVPSEENEYEFELTQCAEMTGSEGSSAKRVRDYRNKQKALQCNTDVTDGNTDVQNGNTDIEIEKDIETELETEKESEKESELESDKEKESEKEYLTISKDIVCRTEVQRILESWNSLKDYGIPQVTRFTLDSKRGQMLTARMKQYGTGAVLEAIEQIKVSDFLQGKVNDFVCTFDWFVKPNNFPKVAEGNYTNRDRARPTEQEEYMDMWKEG